MWVSTVDDPFRVVKYAFDNPLRFFDLDGRQARQSQQEKSLSQQLLDLLERYFPPPDQMIEDPNVPSIRKFVRKLLADPEGTIVESVPTPEQNTLEPDPKVTKEKIKEAIRTAKKAKALADTIKGETTKPKIVKEDEGEPTASFDPADPKSGRVPTDPPGTMRGPSGELIDIDVERALDDLEIRRPDKPIRFRLPFEGESPLDRLPRRTGKRDPTQGILVIGDREVDLVSGEGGMAGGLRQQGHKGFTVFNETHVEPQAAEVMRQTGAKEGTVYINHEGGPCGGAAGCDNNLEKMLPEGSKLHVVWPNGEKTFEGKKK